MAFSVSCLISVLFLASAASADDVYLLTVEDYQIPWNVGINVSKKITFSRYMGNIGVFFVSPLQNGENDYPQPLIVTVNLDVKDSDWNIYENGLFISCIFLGGGDQRHFPHFGTKTVTAFCGCLQHTEYVCPLFMTQ